MELNIKHAFSSPFSDKQWYIKLIFPLIVCTCFIVFNPNLHISRSIQIIAGFVLAVPYLILWGFFIRFQHNEINNKTPLLPELKNKIKDYVNYGIRLTGICLIYVAFSFILFIVTLFIAKINFLINILSIFTFIGLVIFLWIALIFSESSYADEFSFKNAINFKRVFKLMSKVKLEILIWLLILVLLGLVLKTIIMLANFTLIVYPFVRVFIKLVLNNLSAQMYKIAKDRL